MTSPRDQASLLDLVRERIVRQFHPLRLILFGSRATNDAHPDSDLDLLVVLPEAPDKRAAAISIRRALCDLPETLNTIADELLEILAKQGVETTETIGSRVEYSFRRVVQRVTVEGPGQDGTVTRIQRKGFRHGSTVIRCEDVAVGKLDAATINSSGREQTTEPSRE